MLCCTKELIETLIITLTAVAEPVQRNLSLQLELGDTLWELKIQAREKQK